MKHYNVKLISIIAAGLIAGTSTVPPAWTQNTQSSQFKNILELAKQENFRFLNYMNAPWIDDDRPYISIRSQIDSQIARGESSVKIMSDWQTPFNKNPTNLQLIFGYTYSAEEVLHAENKLGPESNQAVDGAQAAIDQLAPYIMASKPKVKLPRTYNFSRLIFIASGPDRALIPLGRKLHQIAPHDSEVIYHLLDCMFNEGPDVKITRKKFDEALNISDTLPSLVPGSAEY